MPLTAQQILVSGKVTDGNLPISGANVLIKNTKTGVVTDFDGRYNITAKPTDTLQISYLGYTTITIPIQSRTTIHVTLQEDVTALGEVQINAGYYTTTDREKTGSIARITAKEIEKQPVNNPLAAMQGHLTGVDIVQRTGVPGAGYSIEIRGKNFINGDTEPLYIIDGVPFAGQSLESRFIGSSINQGNVSPLNFLNTTDIQSIEVLKDTDATAIYGSRGANGVVLITTKKGGRGKTQFKTNIASTLGHVTSYRDLMNTEQYLEVVREGIINDGYGAYLDNPSFDFLWPELKTWNPKRYTDWQKELIGGTAYRNDAHLSMSGGENQTQFLISIGALKETTVFPGDANYKKISGHSNFNQQSTDNRFKIHVTTGYTIEDNQLPRQDLTNLANRLPPNAPRLYDELGNINWEDSTWDNPLASLKQKYRAKTNTLIMNMGISYEIIHNLALKTNFGYTINQLESHRIFPSTARRPSLMLDASSSSFDINRSNRNSWVAEPQLNWRHQWGKMHLDILAGTTFQNQSSQSLVQTGRGFSSNALLLNLSAAKTISVATDSNSEYRYHAIFGRVNINWDGKYILNLTGRRDGSSRFGPGKQFGNFGAIGATWLFSEEEFLKPGSFLTFGKLRGSFGTTGSDNIGDYKFLSTYGITGFEYDGVSVLEPSGISNPLFAWEANKKLEVALELGFFKDRVLLNTSWHQNRSSNQLIGIPLATTTGFNNLTGNFDATVENTGFELDIRTLNIQSKNFTWRTTLNLTIPKNKLVKFPDLENSAFANRYRIGKSLTSMPMYQALGVDPETGLYQFKDYNNDGMTSALDDKQWFEDFAPTFYGGFGNTVTYKDITLDFFLQFKKQKNYNHLYSGATIGFQQNTPVALIDRWQVPGDIRSIQRASALGVFPGVLTGDQYQRESNAAVSDASFIRLRNITLTYNIPKSISKNTNLSLYLQGQNLLTLTKYQGADPEQVSLEILPPLRQITMGIQLGF
ncbi:SusC/RagA family TonB-linked outer membrane protein [Gelidibacter japonicus]|uniref:SusC/RagA family TonB-linked outer membrane protein n=1 Tax=Gelidibacter japonicus TaxID=1962232 RepID=UPI003A8F2F45